jgi:phosphoribosylanthranilate isomerase
MFRVKICGITTREDALAAAEAGADAVGLNFWQGSRRYLKPEQAAAIAAALPPAILRVGVFVNADATTIREVHSAVGLNLLQLHGDEPPAFLQSLRSSDVASLPVMRALACAGSLEHVTAYLGRCQTLDCMPRLILLDAAMPGARGGTGALCDWRAAARYGDLEEVPPLVLAGGLTADNVADAITAVRPSAVDVASGVEDMPGRKSADRMRRFVTAARAALEEV